MPTMPRPALRNLALAAAACAFLAGSLALKVSLRPANGEEVVEAEIERAMNTAAALLEDASLSITERSTSSVPTMEAAAGACALTIVFGDPRGFHRDTVAMLATAADRQHTFYAGQDHARLPVVRSRLAYYSWAALAEMGFAEGYPLVEHVIVRPGCGDQAELLDGLRRITGPEA